MKNLRKWVFLFHCDLWILQAGA